MKTQRSADRLRHELGISNGGELDEAHTIAERIHQVGRQLQRQAGLAAPASARQCEQPSLGLEDEVPCCGKVLFASNQTRARGGQVVPRGPFHGQVARHREPS
jgi:hypothetical protein